MADFTQSYIQDSSGSAFSPLPPITDNSTASGIGAMAAVAGQGAEFLGNALERKQKAEKELLEAQLKATQDQAVADFAKRQLAITGAVETGEIRSSSAARMQMRKNLSEAIANNPALVTELTNAHKAVTKTSGLGDAVYEGTQAEQQQTAVINAAVQAGWVRPDASQDEQLEAAFQWQQFNKAKDVLSEQTARVNLASAQVGLGTARINQQSARLSLVEKQAKAASQAALGQGVVAFQTKLRNDLESLRQQKERGEIDALQYDMGVDAVYQAVTSTVNSVGGQAGADYLKGMTSGLEMMRDNYKRYGSGELQLKDLENKNQIAVATNAANALGDPQIAKIAGFSSVIRNADPGLIVNMNTISARYLDSGNNIESKPADVMPDTAEDKKNVDDYLKILTSSVDKINNGSADNAAQTTQEVNNNLVNILKAVDVYSPTTSKPEDFNSVMKFLADPKMGKFIAGQGGIPSTVVPQAVNALDFEYKQKVLPLIQEEFQKAMTGGTATITYQGRTEVPGVKNQKPASELIKPVFSGSGVTFTVDPSVKDSFVRAKVRDLNNKVAPVLNQMIRVDAHLAGSTNYKQTYEQNYSDLFTPAEAQDAGQDN